MSLSAIVTKNEGLSGYSSPSQKDRMSPVEFPIMANKVPSSLIHRSLSPRDPSTPSPTISQKMVPSKISIDAPDPTFSPVTIVEILSFEKPIIQYRIPAVYKEVTRRIAPEELHKLETKMKALNPEAHENFLELVQTGNLAEIVEIEDYPLHALYALRQGRLAEALKKEASSEVDDAAIQDAFATLVMPWASKDDEKICIPLFDETGKMNVVARSWIQETLSIKIGAIFSDEELDLFFEDMAKLPKLQQHFWLEKTRYDSISLIDVRDGIRQNYRELNVFSKTLNNGLMIPSAGMMQTFLKRKFGTNAVRMNFVLGLSSLQDIQDNGTTDTRDAGLRFPQIRFPNTADGFAALQTDFLYHDFFHAIIVSLSTPETRKLVIHLTNFIKPLKNGNHVLMDLYARLIDMETSEHFLKITSPIIPSDTISDFVSYSLGSVISLTPTPFYTFAIGLAIVNIIYEHAPLYPQDILQIPQFFCLLLIALIKSFVVSIVRQVSPYKRMRKSEKNAIEDLQESIQQALTSEQDPKYVRSLEQEWNALANKTHSLQIPQK